MDNLVNHESLTTADSKNIIQGKNYRITLLSERLVRLEYSKNGIFEDHKTPLVVNRNFPRVNYFKDNTETLLQIKTSYFTLTYVMEKPITPSKMLATSNLKISLNGTDKEWFPGHIETRNFGGINYSLDDFSGNLKLDKGLYSTDGFVSLDDSNSLIFDGNNYIERQNKETDIYVFMYKKDLGLCLQDYFLLTGYPPLIPRYALGNWWYKDEDYNIYQVDDVIKNFIKNNIPLSVFILGDKALDNYNLDSRKFNASNIRKYFDYYNIKYGLTINPDISINEDNSKYQDIIKFIPPTIENSKKKNKKKKVSNNKINFIPFSNEKLKVYFDYFITPLMKTGTSIFNIDYNNILNKKDLWLLDNYHYNMLNASERNVILTRNSGIAPHRVPIFYTGKTKVNWETLNIIPFYNLSAANIGISWIAHPIGGFYGGIEDRELYIRYIELGTFSPILMLSSAAGKYYKREPWKWNSLDQNIINYYLNLRNKIIPYIYTEAYLYHKYGKPLITPLYYSYPRAYDEPLYRNEYFFGSNILIAPITKLKNKVMNRVVQRVFVPNGIWYDFITGKKFIGNKYYVSFYRDDEYPIFCKSGAIIPLSLDNTVNIPKNLELQVFPGVSNKYDLYEDDGETYKYLTNNEYLITTISYDYLPDDYIVKIRKKEGSYPPFKRNYSIRFRNVKNPNEVKVLINGNNVLAKYNIDKNDLVVNINDVSTNDNVEVKVLGQNIEISTSQVINDEISSILEDLEIETTLKDKIDNIIFSDLSVKKKRIEIRKLKKYKLEPKFIDMFISLLEFISK